ncbi:MAG: ankyrin repeat domain-containing protein [Chlamydiales bacterium]|nr:ankyrin repeat domain-containing protein [Chlamydiales bacterium]
MTVKAAGSPSPETKGPQISEAKEFASSSRGAPIPDTLVSAGSPESEEPGCCLGTFYSCLSFICYPFTCLLECLRCLFCCEGESEEKEASVDDTSSAGSAETSGVESPAEAVSSLDEQFNALCMAKNTAELEALIDNWGAQDAAQKEGWSPLCDLLLYNMHHLIPRLLKAGADVNSTNSTGKNVLHMCCCVKWLGLKIEGKPLIQTIIEAGADVNKPDRTGNTPLHVAVTHCALEEARQMLSLSGSALKINQKNCLGETALHLACKSVHVESAHVEFVKLLLQNGADALEEDNCDRMPLHRLCANKEKEKGVEMIDLLSKQLGFDVNAERTDCTTALHLACIKGSEKYAKQLLKLGADPRAIDLLGRTPLHYAAMNGEINLVCLLVQEYNQNINACDLSGMTPLHLVCLNEMGLKLKTERRPMVEVLMELGADEKIGGTVDGQEKLPDLKFMTESTPEPKKSAAPKKRGRTDKGEVAATLALPVDLGTVVRVRKKTVKPESKR